MSELNDQRSEEDAKKQVVTHLKAKGASSPRDLVGSSDAHPPHDLRRAVWALVREGAAEFTPNNEIKLKE